MCLALLVAAFAPVAAMVRVGGSLGWGADDICRAARPDVAEGTQADAGQHPDTAWTRSHCAVFGLAGAAWAPAPDLSPWRLRGPLAGEQPRAIGTALIVCRPERLMARPRAPPAQALNHV